MVRLSPKALRFAENATRELIEDGSFGSWPHEVWDRWIAGRKPQGMATVAPSADGTVDVPGPIAELLTSAIERRIAEMQREFDRAADPEIGNDIAFLNAVLDALRRDDVRLEA